MGCMHWGLVNLDTSLSSEIESSFLLSECPTFWYSHLGLEMMKLVLLWTEMERKHCNWGFPWGQG